MKCHELTFSGEVWHLEGPAGERAVMHATEARTVNPDVRLPGGWTLRAEVLRESLVIHPHGSGDQCAYNIFRDEAVQAYHQIRYASPDPHSPPPPSSGGHPLLSCPLWAP